MIPIYLALLAGGVLFLGGGKKGSSKDLDLEITDEDPGEDLGDIAEEEGVLPDGPVIDGVMQARIRPATTQRGVPMTLPGGGSWAPATSSSDASKASSSTSGGPLLYIVEPPLIDIAVMDDSLEGVLRQALPRVADLKVRSMTKKLPKAVKDIARKNVKKLTKKAIDQAVDAGKLRSIDRYVNDVFRNKYRAKELGIPSIFRKSFDKQRSKIIERVTSSVSRTVKGVRIVPQG